MSGSTDFRDESGIAYGVRRLDTDSGTTKDNTPVVALSDSDGNSTGVQFPVSVDGDSVYEKDIKVSLTDDGTFTGQDINSLFNNLDDSITDISATNPKWFKVFLERPAKVGSVALVAKTGSFRNVQITFLDRQGTLITKTSDAEKADSTPRTSRRFEVTNSVNVCCLLVEFYTAEAITLSFVYVRKQLTVSAVIRGTSELTGISENVGTFRGALSISDGLRHTTGLSVPFHMGDSVSSTLAIQAEIGDTSFTLVDATGFLVGNVVEIYGGAPTGEFFFTITALPGGNVITLDRPVPIVIAAGTGVEVSILNMAVDGTLAAPQIFYIAPPAGAIWQITRVIISMTDATAMDDGTFGGMTALTNGVVLRQKAGGVYANATNWKTNAQIANDMYDFDYIAKPPAGTGYGARGRWTFTNMQAVVELNGDTGDRLELLVQDALSALVTFRMKAQGRLFGG